MGVETQDLGEPQPLHERDMVAVGKPQGALPVECEDLAIGAFAGQHDAGELDEGQEALGNALARLLIPALEAKDGLEDDGVGGADFELALFDAGEQGGGLGGEDRVVVAQVAKQDVGVEEGQGHLASGASFPAHLLGHGLLSGGVFLLGHEAGQRAL